MSKLNQKSFGHNDKTKTSEMSWQPTHDDSPEYDRDLEQNSRDLGDESNTFQRYQVEKTGLEARARFVQLSHEEHERLDVLQARMDGFWERQMNRASRACDLLQRLSLNADTVQKKPLVERAFLPTATAIYSLPNVIQRQTDTVEMDGNEVTIEAAADDFEAASACVTAVIGNPTAERLLAQHAAGEGTTLYFRSADGSRDNICHHYAFGGLSTAVAALNFELSRIARALDALNTQAGRDTFFLATSRAQRSQMTTQQVLDGILALSTIDFSRVEGTADVADALGLGGGAQNFNIRIYGNAHSARYEEGRWFHKFNGVPYVISLAADANFGYGAGTALAIRSVASGAGAEKSVTLRIIEET